MFLSLLTCALELDLTFGLRYLLKRVARLFSETCCSLYLYFRLGFVRVGCLAARVSFTYPVA